MSKIVIEFDSVKDLESLYDLINDEGDERYYPGSIKLFNQLKQILGK